MDSQHSLIFNPEDKKERFLGQEWDLVHDTLIPIKYLSPGAKVRGQLLTQFNSSTIREIPVRRRLVSRVLAQLYEARGIFLSPVVMGMKVFLSCACELATAAQLYMDLRQKDHAFSLLFQNYLLHILDEFDSIVPFR